MAKEQKTLVLYRASGQPIDPDHAKVYMTKLNEKMDNIEATIGKCNKDNAKEFQDMMEIAHRDLSTSYPNKVTIPYPNKLTAMKDLNDKYGSIAFCNEDDKVVAYILDK